jgi:hypothetical protein
VSIRHEAFLERRVRYQDGPDVCYLKLQRELLAADGATIPAHLDVSDADLEEYRLAHDTKGKQRRF